MAKVKTIQKNPPGVKRTQVIGGSVEHKGEIKSAHNLKQTASDYLKDLNVYTTIVLRKKIIKNTEFFHRKRN